MKAIYEKQFEKDLKKTKKRNTDLVKLKKIIIFLLANKKLPTKYLNHKLKGNFKYFWECHIESDWLLIYKKTTSEIILVRMGSHSDLF